ncbi:hypothetical protein EV192_109166 [Actinocrispum wychmicini]|uniref:Integral membrane protein n=2 Tax=Actinocrispum wychmicini TaxID=1213861 RepID=A0A4R2JBQ0_9PSEU|nr:hypothetical protein EV192_109166 [Actinocrispum wychmicini]
MSEMDRRGVEQWFRRRGLPAVVRGLEKNLLVRIVPAVVWLALFDVLYDVLSAIDGDDAFETRLESEAFEVIYTVTLVASIGAPVLGAWLAARWARDRVLHDRGSVSAIVVIATYVLVLPVADHMADGSAVLPTVVEYLAFAVVLLGLTAVGMGSIFGWALRAALRQLRAVGAMTSRAMPLLLLVTTFGFFTTEIWQIAGLVSRGRMWLVISFFAVLGGLFLGSVFVSELRTLTAAAHWPERVSALPEQPFRALMTGAEPADTAPALTRLERANMVLILLLTQMLQALVFGVLVFAVFAILGRLAVPHDAIKSWVGHDPTPGTLFNIQVPAPNELVQVCMFIAGFSALYFVATIVTDAAHRKTYFEPVLEHLEVSLAGRALYLSRFGKQE